MTLKDFNSADITFLKSKARLIRKDIIEMIHMAQAGHPGGSLSAVEIVTALYFYVMNIDPQNPDWEKRDRFILSKGHACPVLYAALIERGFLSVKHLSTLRKTGSLLQGHPNMDTPGVDMLSGSLGNGLAVGIGMALSTRAKNLNYNVYVLMGDGECQEGIVWEAAMAAAHHNVNNIVAIIDYNKLQIRGNVEDVLSLGLISDKWKSFGWHTIEIDGNDMEQVLKAFQTANKIKQPIVIIANTIKGKGVSFMEGKPEWHGQAPNDEQAVKAIKEINQEVM
jgi:transketolase